MAKTLRLLTRLFRSCFDHRLARPRNHSPGRFRPRLECLETRINPALFSQAGTVLTITLDNPSEAAAFTTNGTSINVALTGGTATNDGSVPAANVTGFGNSNATITSSDYSQIKVQDAAPGTSVAFNNSSGSYGVAFQVNLTDPSSGNIAFNGTSTFNLVDLTASTTGGAVTFATGSALDFPSTGDLSLSSGASASLDLGNIFLNNSGSLSVSAAGTIDQLSGTTISAGAGTFTITANSGDILLGGTSGSTSVDGGTTSPNLFTGGVTMTESGSGTLDNVSLRNISRTASLPSVPPLTTTGITDYSLYFDNTGITLPAITVGGALNITAGGEINQTGVLTAATANFTVRGDALIYLLVDNNISGTLGLNCPRSSQGFFFANSSGIQVGDWQLGRGSLILVAETGNITTASGGKIEQEEGCTGTATFDVRTGSIIDLNGDNDFTCPLLQFIGNGLTTLSVTNDDPLATMANVEVPSTVANLTIEFDSASVVLPTLSLTSVTVTGEGIFQQTGSTLTAGTAVFNSLGPINLPGANAITNIQLNTVFGPLPAGTLSQDVTAVNDTGALNFVGTSSLLGQLSVSAGGFITESSGASIVLGGPAAMPASFTTSSGDIVLDQNNKFTNPVSVTVSGISAVTLVNGPGDGPLTLGNVVTANPGGINATADEILQAPGTSLLVGGSGFFGANGITLESRGNTFLRTVVLESSSGSASITSSGPLSLIATISRDLDVTAGGAITQLPGFYLDVGGEASFRAGTAAITLPSKTNKFGSLSLVCAGTAAVSVSIEGSVQLDQVVLGSGDLTLATTGSITQAADGLLYQIGPGAISLTLGFQGNVLLSGNHNVLLGDLTIATIGTPADNLPAGDITVDDQGDLNLAGLPATAAAVSLSATGELTLPSTPFSCSSLTVSSRLTSISSDITTTAGDVEFVGPVDFSGDRTIDTQAIFFNGDVSTTGTLTLNVADGVSLSEGVWNQGSNNLAINGSGAFLFIYSGTTFAMTSGTISMPGEGNMMVFSGATFNVGTPGAAQTVTLNNGSGTLTFNNLSRFEVGLGSTNAQLVKQGSGKVIIQSSAGLIGDGLASTTASPVLTVSGGGTISGAYQNFTGSDFFTATTSATQVTVVQVDTASSGTVTGFNPDGDQWTVTTSLGAAAGLLVLQSPAGSLAGSLSIVVRNNTFSSPWTLTITTTPSGGDGFTPVALIATNAPGPVTINAPTVDLVAGDPTIRTAGTLAALNVRDMGTPTNPHIVIEGGGPATGTTTITAGILRDPSIELNGILSSFRAQSVNGGNFAAQSFGSITTTGNAASLDPGNFNATLRSQTTANGIVLSSATIAGTLGGTWDLRGAVGTVVAAAANDWTLGQIPALGDDARNSHLLTNVTSLNLGNVTSSNVLVTGLVASLTASQIEGSNLVAGSFGTIKTTGSSAANLVGDLSGTTIAALSGVGATALGTLSVAGSLNGTTVEVADGNVTSISVGRSVENGTQILDHFCPLSSVGQIGSITAGAWDSSDVTANSIGTFKIAGYLPANLFGDFTSSTVTLDGNAGGSAALALGTFSASGDMNDSSFSIQDGNVTSFSVAGEFQGSQLNLTDPATSSLGAFSAGDSSGTPSSLTARTIGTFSVTGTPASFRRSPSLSGDLASATVTAFQSSGTTPGIGTFKVNGNVNASTIAAAQGITSVSVGRSVENSSEFLSTNSLTGKSTVGRIGSLSAGAWSSSDLLATSLGMAAITGFSTLENSTSVRTAGDWVGGDIVVLGDSPLPSLSIAGMMSNALLIATGGINTLSAAGSVIASTVVTADNNPASPFGILGTFTAGDMTGSTIEAGFIDTLKTTGITARGLFGSITNSEISVSGTTTVNGRPFVGLVNLSVAGDFVSSSLDAPGRVLAVSVGGNLGVNGTAPSHIAAGYAPGTGLDSLTAGASFGAELVSFSVTSVKIMGNAGRRLTGNFRESFMDVIGNIGKVGLGSFSATGNVSSSLFNIADGNVTSFIVTRFQQSDLLVGFRLEQLGDITAAPAMTDWAGNFTIGTFKTTGLFSASSQQTASFNGSDVVAATLGNVSLSGILGSPGSVPGLVENTGVAFRNSAGSKAKGTVTLGTIAGTLTPAPPFQLFGTPPVDLLNDEYVFEYLGLGG